MFKLTRLFILSLILIVVKPASAQFELKSQFNIGNYTPKKNKQIILYGIDFSGYYLFDNSLGLGIYGSGNKVNSAFDTHRIFAVGGEIEWSVFRHWQVKPMVNARLGYCTERSKGQFSIGNKFDRRLEGINTAFHLGLKTNMQKLNHIQFGLSAGAVSYTIKPFSIFGSGGLSFIQYGIQCIYSFETKKQNDYFFD